MFGSSRLNCAGPETTGPRPPAACRARHASKIDGFLRLWSNVRMERFFIVSSGRTGTSLLAAIMHDAGADFGVEARAGWDRRGGEMELHEMRRACYLLARAGVRPSFGLALAEWTWRRWRARTLLKKALRSAQYFKLMVPAAARMIEQAGYKPVIILNSRRFAPTVASFAKTTGGVYGFEEVARRYTEVYRDGLMLLERYGGCVVDYDEIVDLECSEWAERLGACTGLKPGDLLSARDNRCNGRPVATASFPLTDPRAEETYQAIMAR